jgi:hypothetical protein
MGFAFPVSDSDLGGLGFGVSVGSTVDLKYFEFHNRTILVLRVEAGTVEADNPVGMPAREVVYLLKYPFVFNAVPVKVTPILGYGGITVNDVGVSTGLKAGLTLGGNIDLGISKISYLRSEYLHFIGFDGSSGMSLRAGGGLDIAWGKKKKAFLRTELLYNWLNAYSKEYTVKDEQRVNGKSAVQYMDIKAGIGYKWGGVQKVAVPVEVQGVKAK